VVVNRGKDFSDGQSAQVAVTESEQPAVLVELPSQEIRAVSDQVLSLLGTTREQLVGHRVNEFVAQEPSGAIALIAAGRLDGAQATRILSSPEGQVRPVQAWAHALGQRRPPSYAVILLIDEAVKRDHQPHGPLRAYGVVDESWRIDHISSSAADLLGYHADDMVGLLLTDLVHPHDVPEILAGLASAERTQLHTLARVRISDAHHQRHWFQIRLGPLVRPPGFGFVLRPLTDQPEQPPDPTAGLHEFLAQVSGETLADVALMPGPRMPTSLQLPALAKLSSQEWEVMVRLNTGASEQQIATALHLGPNIVRSHLAATFELLSVHSTQELVDLLANAAQLPDVL
jgi:PAS domain-containing protein/DNA-binding CsgD family transcriptional regulator